MSDLGSLIRTLIDDGASPEVAGDAIAQAYGAGVASVSMRSAGAIRQERYRHNKASLSVTNRNEVTGEDDKKKNPPTPPLKKKHTPEEANASSAPKRETRGHRLPEDFSLTESRLAYALGKGMSVSRAETDFEMFCAHFWASSGANAVKKNWDRAWQKWVMISLRRNPMRGDNGQNLSALDAARAVRAAIDRRPDSPSDRGVILSLPAR